MAIIETCGIVFHLAVMSCLHAKCAQNAVEMKMPDSVTACESPFARCSSGFQIEPSSLINLLMAVASSQSVAFYFYCCIFSCTLHINERCEIESSYLILPFSFLI